MQTQPVEKKDLTDMVEVITLAIVHLQTEEHFFQRSADGSTNESAKTLFTEIAEEIGRCRKSLEVKHQMLMRILISPESFRE
jgi:rubrerythrin